MKGLTKLPDSWMGLWQDAIGRVMQIDRGKKDGMYQVCIAPAQGKKLHKKKMRACISWDQKRSCNYLQVEAGFSNLGPTYNLFFATCTSPLKTLDDTSAQFRIASLEDSVDTLALLPEVSMGLYDDYEDDLGVPWGFPYHPYYKSPKVNAQKKS